MPRTVRKQSVYYAHPMCTYGYPAEGLELQAIKEAFPKCKIINPAEYDGHPGKRREGLNFCLRLIKKSDRVVFTRLLGEITCGVGAEVNHALDLGKQVLELRDREFIPLTQPVRFISYAATIALYRRFEAL